MNVGETVMDKRNHQPGTKEFLVIGFNYWGCGDDVATAKKAFSRSGGKLMDGYMIVTFGPDQQFEGVDDFGRYQWKGNIDSPAKRYVYGARFKRGQED